MNRREWLATAGVFGMSALAGCSQAQSIVRTGPPNFENVEISAPESVEVGDSVELEVTAKNTGGESGDFTTTLTIGSGVFSTDQNVRIESIPVTESKSTTIGPYMTDTARSVTFRITDYGAEQQVDIQTRAVDGTSYQRPNGLTYSLSDVQVEPPQIREGAVQSANDKPLVAHFVWELSNSQNESITIPSLSGVLVNGESTSVSDIVPPSNVSEAGDSWAGYSLPEISPGGSLTVHQSVGVSPAAADSFAVAVDAAGNDTPEFRFSLPQDTRSKVSEEPVFDIKSFDIPDSIAPWKAIDITAAVENTGQSGGEFAAQVIVGENSAGLLTEEIAAGGSKTISQSVSPEHTWPDENQVEVALDHGYTAERSSLKISAPTLDFGESEISPSGLDISVSEPVLNNSFQYQSWGDMRQKEAGDGEQYAIVYLQTTNTHSEETPSVNQKDIKFYDGDGKVGEGEYPAHIVMAGGDTISGPVSGTLYDTWGQIPAGETFTGYIVGSIPDDVSMADLRVIFDWGGFDQSSNRIYWE